MNNISRPLLHSVMKRAAEHLIPLQVSIELTYRCNLACKHCYIDVEEDDELSSTELRGIIDQLADAGTLYLMLTGGEPLIREDFFDIAFYMKERGFLIQLLTNGTLITPDVAGDIQRLEPLNVTMSLHGANADTHDSITGRQGSFTSTLNAVELLKNQGITVLLQTLLMDSNSHEAADMKVLAEETGVFLRIGSQFVPTRSGSTEPLCYQASLDDLCTSYNRGLLNIDITNCNTGGTCKAGKGICSISPNGTVLPCLLMPMKLGNLRQAKFSEIWRTNPSEELKRLRCIDENDFPDCKDCELVQYCQKCIGTNYAETGKLTEPAPSTCRNAALKRELLNRKGVVV